MKIVRKKRNKPMVAAEEKAIDQSKRELMKKKRRNKLKRRLIIFLFLAVCFGAIFAVLKAPAFNVKTVYCVGHQRLTEQQVLKIAQVETGRNIFSTNIRAVKKRLADNPEIAESNVRRIFPNKIKVWVKEAEATVFVRVDEKVILADSKGKIIRIPTAEELEQLKLPAEVCGVEIVSQNPGEYITAADDRRAGELYKCIEVLSDLEMMKKVNYIDFEDLSDIKIDYENRLYMLLGSYEKLEYKLKFSKKVIEENISEYEKALFDYRGDKLYVGPREDPEAVDDPEEAKADGEAETDDAAQTESSEADGEKTEANEEASEVVAENESANETQSQE